MKRIRNLKRNAKSELEASNDDPNNNRKPNAKKVNFEHVNGVSKNLNGSDCKKNSSEVHSSKRIARRRIGIRYSDSSSSDSELSNKDREKLAENAAHTALKDIEELSLELRTQADCIKQLAHKNQRHRVQNKIGKLLRECIKRAKAINKVYTFSLSSVGESINYSDDEKESQNVVPEKTLDQDCSVPGLNCSQVAECSDSDSASPSVLLSDGGEIADRVVVKQDPSESADTNSAPFSNNDNPDSVPSRYNWSLSPIEEAEIVADKAKTSTVDDSQHSETETFCTAENSGCFAPTESAEAGANDTDTVPGEQRGTGIDNNTGEQHNTSESNTDSDIMHSQPRKVNTSEKLESMQEAANKALLKNILGVTSDEEQLSDSSSLSLDFDDITEKNSRRTYNKNGRSGKGRKCVKNVDDEDSEVKKLLNMNTLKRRRQKPLDSHDSDNDSVSSKELVLKKKSKLSTKPETVVDFLDKPESDTEKEEEEMEDSLGKGIESHSNKKQLNAVVDRNEISHRLALLASCSEEEMDSDGSKGKSDGDDKKGRKRKNVSQEKSKDENSRLSDSGEEERKKMKKWRRDRLLCQKLSDTDTSDEERKLEKLKKERNVVLTSSQNKDSSDSEEIFLPRKRNVFAKKKIKSSSSSSGISTPVVSDKSSDEEIEKPKKQTKRRRRIKKPATDSESGSDDCVIIFQGKSGRKNIRKVIGEQDIAESTKQTLKREEERKKRIQERQQLYNESFSAIPEEDSTVESLVLDFDPETKEELISVHPDLIKKLKPHQAKGVKFMWDSCFESLKEMKNSKGTGCILAHCMGLGKTLQVITLIHTLLTNEETNIRTVLIVCPLSTVLNWVNEFNIWLEDIDTEQINIVHLTKTHTNISRPDHLDFWHSSGGVCIMGYDMFRNMVNDGDKMGKKVKETICSALLDPGPDLVICDEGHMLKNEKTKISKAINQVRTARRIVLTGTPIQNNLLEYHCMVQFVKPNLLGNKKEYRNRFVNPITNGQYVDSTSHDVRVMKRRAHVLHRMLDATVQRFDYSVLIPFLPPKHEYVVYVRLSDVQADLYEYYLSNLTGRTSEGGVSLFQDYQALRLIWTHPYVMKIAEEKKEKAAEQALNDEDSEGSLKDFVVDSSDELNSSGDSTSESSADSGRSRRVTRATGDITEEMDEPSPPEKKKVLVASIRY